MNVRASSTTPVPGAAPVLGPARSAGRSHAGPNATTHVYTSMAMALCGTHKTRSRCMNPLHGKYRAGVGIRCAAMVTYRAQRARGALAALIETLLPRIVSAG